LAENFVVLASQKQGRIYLGQAIGACPLSYLVYVQYFLSFFLLIRFVFKFTSIRPVNLKFFSVLIIAILSSIPMYFAITYSKIYNLNVIFSVSIGTIIYFSFLFCIKNLKRVKLLMR